MERKFNVKLVRTYMYCPKCPGVMEQCNWGNVLVSNGITNVTAVSDSLYLPQTSQSFNHKCNKCGHGETYDKSYPTLEYVDDGELG